MDTEFVEYCRQNYQKDGNYAVAYAIMLTNGEKPKQLKEGIFAYVPTDQDRETILSWISDNNRVRFCLKEVWCEAMGYAPELLTPDKARGLAGYFRNHNIAACIGARNTEKYGKAKTWIVTMRDPIETDDDLGI